MLLNKYIDFTLLKPNATQSQIKNLCAEAIQYNFKAVCVPLYYVPLAYTCLQNSSVKVATVISFSMGNTFTINKLQEIQTAHQHHAAEVDVVLNLHAVKNGEWEYIHNELQQIAYACTHLGVVSKIIIETGLLTDAEIIQICEISNCYTINCIKTSTGINTPTGATTHAIELLKKHLKPSIFIKASGGIKNAQQATELIQAGAERIGCSQNLML